MRTFEGTLVAGDQRFAIVVSRFNEFIGRSLLTGALDGLRRHGGSEERVDLVWVPGAFEIPLVARKLAASGQYGAVICLGAVIRGSTAHFDYVAGGAASGIASASMETGIPIVFGVLTTDTIEQAIERAGVKSGNKGYEAAVTAIEMVNLLAQLESASS